MTPNSTKKRLVTSFNNLTAEQQEAVKALYPRGFAEVMTRIDKPNGDFFYVVPYETDEGFRQNVIFPGGMILEDDGEVKIYYGAADTVECLATASLSDLIALCTEKL